ncbi:MAG TPA: response regulator transcription factor [Thermoanaerobaculia bacterium]|jgi:DNA-binding response OmpR family regulator|nr:response regulator transcription factor [Thermoanaerobaculia bacterium]
MTPRTILVIEDDLSIRRGMVAALRYASYEVREAGDGVGGAELALAGDVDLVLLDLVLPRCDGLEVLRRIRSEEPALPVIVVTARGAEEERVRGLELGADDYVVKPFSARELLARVEAVLRRSPGRPQGPRSLQLATGEVDLDRGEVRLNGGGCEDLSKLETDLLRYLARSRDRIVSRDELLVRVWQQKPHLVATRSVDMTIARLRKKLGGRGVLVTIRGKGYRLNP